MKILLDKYPKGTLKGQKTDGRYIDGYLYENLSILADSIVNDMTFLAVIFSSTLEVGTGKSVLATQIGEAWTRLIKEKHGIENPWGINNLIWRPKDLIERAFKVPKYSYILLDEWEDSHYWSELGITLRQFFRKCRQLNLFIMVIIPNWFQLPMSYAISRSIFAIDVKFGDNFERGFFDFYGFESKRNLYVQGKKFHNYRAWKPDFDGVFYDGYGVDEKEYRDKKLKDMLEWDEEEKDPRTKAIEKRDEVLRKMYQSGMTQKEIAKIVGLNQKTISDIINKEIVSNKPTVPLGMKVRDDYNNDTIIKNNLLDDGEEEQ